MIHICQKCEKVIQDGDRIRVPVEVTYRLIPSTSFFAFDKTDLVADSEQLEHISCPIGYEGD